MIRSRRTSSDQRRAASSQSTSSKCLLWIVAAGIIALIVYLTALKHVRDFAVLKATGTSNTTLFGALALQAVVLSLVSAVVAIAIALALAPFFPFQIVVAASAYVLLAVVAIVVGLLASTRGFGGPLVWIRRSRFGGT